MTDDHKGNGNGSNGSRLDWLRARHEAITATRTLDKEVPGYGGRLVVRYSPPPFKIVAKTQALMANSNGNDDGLLNANCDFLVAACVAVLYRGEGDDEALVPVDPSGEVRRFDPALAALFNADAKTARQVIRHVFGNDFALSVQAGEVISWAAESQADANEELSGESEAVVT